MKTDRRSFLGMLAALFVSVKAMGTFKSCDFPDSLLSIRDTEIQESIGIDEETGIPVRTVRKRVNGSEWKEISREDWRVTFGKLKT